MREGLTQALAAVGAACVLTASACSGGPGRVAGPPSSRASSAGSLAGPAAGPGYDAGLRGVVNPSAATGGTLTLDLVGQPDSLDYQDTGDPFVWDFARLYSMQLLTYRSCPGACGRELVPDLATGLGAVTDHGLVWTYHLHSGVRFQNGRVVTAADVRYGIERSYARLQLPFGPDYLQTLLRNPGYQGPYAGSGAGLSSVTTPGPRTIQFHLTQPFADFNYVAASLLTTPVWPGWDTGARRGASFQLDPISTGPYEFLRYRPGRLLVLVRNPYWRQALDPQARQLPARIVVRMGLAPAAVDADLIAGRADAELSGAGLQPAAAGSVLGNARLRTRADRTPTGVSEFAYLNTQLIPNVHCREAIEYAASKTAVLRAFGGATAGAVASAVLPPTLAGYQPSNQFGALTAPAGNLAAARAELRSCGKPGGFSTTLAFPAVPAEAAAARALSASLARAGITVRLVGFPAARYYSAYAGSPAFVLRHDLGIAMGTWRASWPDGYAFLNELANGSAISYQGGNINIAQLDVPAVNALFARGLAGTTSAPGVWGQIASRVLDAAAILPLVDQAVTLYRNPQLTNVYADDAYGMYNYAVLGVR